jgi:hypothetical protein
MFSARRAFPWIAAPLAALSAAACIATHTDTLEQPRAGQATSSSPLPIATDVVDVAPAAGRLSSAGSASSARRCPGCGFVEAVRELGNGQNRLAPVAVEIEVGTPRFAGPALEGRKHVVEVRLRDGSITSFETTSPRSWRVGQRVNVIGGSQLAAR